ncbi:MAG: site-2 protease family protein, partial [bacterium]
MDKEPPSPNVEFKMAIAGPIMSFCLAIIFFGLSQGLFNLGVSGPILSMLYYLAMLNMVVGLFNMIPGFPLDGGRILRAFLWHSFKDIKRATAIASNIGKGFAFILIAFGIFNLLNGSLISGIWFIFIGLFVQEAANGSYRQVIMKKILTGIKVENFMTKSVIIVPANLTLDKLVEEYFFKFRHASFPVMEDDLILGLVTFHDIKEIDKDEWTKKTARDIMLPLSEQLVSGKEVEAMDAMTKLVHNGVGRLLIIEKSKLVGVLSQKDIMQLFKYKAELEGGREAD